MAVCRRMSDGVPIEAPIDLKSPHATLRRSSPVLPCDVTAVWLRAEAGVHDLV